MKKVKIVKPCSLGEKGAIIEVSEDILELYKNYVEEVKEKEMKDYKNKMMKKSRAKTK